MDRKITKYSIETRRDESPRREERPKRGSYSGELLTNETLIMRLKAAGTLKSPRVIDAMLEVDRGFYIKENPYVDIPRPIAQGVTLCAPHSHAMLLELIKDNLITGATALNIGMGTGYLTACMALLVGPTGHVVGLSRTKEFVDLNKLNIERNKPRLLWTKAVILVEGDPKKGWPDLSPYDAIHMGVATDTIPHALFSQLKPGGRMVVPVGPNGSYDQIETIDKLPGGGLQRNVWLYVGGS